LITGNVLMDVALAQTVPLVNHLFMRPVPINAIVIECKNERFLCWFNVDIVGDPGASSPELRQRPDGRTDVRRRAGMLRRVTDRLAHDGIDIHHLNATAAATQDQCLVVFATDSNDRAAPPDLFPVWRCPDPSPGRPASHRVGELRDR
jgi:hypothetical protein